MARSKSFFGLRRGSTKSHTYQVLRGEQITKDRVYDVSNPQTEAQMRQRLKVPLVAAARSVLSTLVDHSFEGVNYGDASLKEFSSLNLQAGNLTVYEYVPKTAMDTGLANFIISRGSLPVPTFDFLGKDNGRIQLNRTTKDLDAPLEGLTNEEEDVEDAPLTQNILDKVCSALGIEANGQLTFLFCFKGDEYEFTSGSQENQANDVLGHYHRFVISRIFNDLERMKDWKVSTTTNADKELQRIDLTDGYLDVSIMTARVEVGGVDDPQGACVIYSRQDNQVWKRSTSRLEVFEGTVDKTLAYDYCVYSYLNKSTAAKSNKYLNTGAEGVDITGGRTSNA